MANRQPLKKCLVVALCHNLHYIHVGRVGVCFGYVCVLQFATGY